MATLTKFKHQLEPTPGSEGWKGYTHPSDLKAKDSWSFYLYKYGTEWAFDFHETQLYAEGLLNGTEKALDYLYFQLSKEHANYNSGMYATFSCKKLEGFEPTTTLHFTGEDDSLTFNPKASFYKDEESGEMCWLCPLWWNMWEGNPPQTCYLYLTLEN